MRRTLGVLFVLLSASGLVTPASAQEAEASSGGGQTSGFSLGQNYPNPFNPETTIPFVLGEDLFVPGPVVVSMRIYNLLQQFVAAPVALRHPSGEGTPLLGLEYLQPGRYEAYWDGRDQNGRQVASGVYFVQLTVNGVSKHRRMFVTK